ncbi:hypothetical protein DL764_002460 [Monosporascus ibericus]|uniref:Uncharacterized protein n=1 Tax=Monosporascus ibericus TaxID=155417 RepID=A0A4Q4TPW3_9PEZI|nr:hypothetical protein DL764_002460 [Monosporascus ibericus]
MTTRSVSPGAALLRASRMFSMPAPIPAPPGDFSSATKHSSPTATIPFPTHLSVTTPSSSRITGDWGFKRPLPLKTTTNTTIPLVRVRQVDSIEHVTDFQSASDHTITLEKFLELHLPLTVPAADVRDLQDATIKPKSVFEEDRDVTAIPDGKEQELGNKRWRFKGPWLAGMTDGAFGKYLEKEVRGRRTEFRAFLKERLAAEMTKDQASEAIEKAVDAPEPVTAADVTEEQLVEYMKRLRSEKIELYRLVSRFLDLAPLAQPFNPADAAPNKMYELSRPNVYSESGPPITHPSAGLSYLRTRRFQENHPLYGPQLHHPPVEARVVMPRHSPTGNYNPILGVGGFIADIGQDTSFNSSRMRKDPDLTAFDLETRGGAKKYADIKVANVDSRGKVIMQVEDAYSEAGLVQKEMMGRYSLYEEHFTSNRKPTAPYSPVRRSEFSRPSTQRFGSSQSYGLGKGDFGRNL